MVIYYLCNFSIFCYIIIYYLLVAIVSFSLLLSQIYIYIYICIICILYIYLIIYILYIYFIYIYLHNNFWYYYLDHLIVYHHQQQSNKKVTQKISPFWRSFLSLKYHVIITVTITTAILTFIFINHIIISITVIVVIVIITDSCLAIVSLNALSIFCYLFYTEIQSTFQVVQLWFLETSSTTFIIYLCVPIESQSQNPVISRQFIGGPIRQNLISSITNDLRSCRTT